MKNETTPNIRIVLKNDAELLHKKYQEENNNIDYKNGDFIKILYSEQGSNTVEHMWFMIDEKVSDDGDYLCTLDNVPVQDFNIKCGDKVVINKRLFENHIINDVMWYHPLHQSFNKKLNP